MNFGFSIVFFAVWPGGRRCANCRDAHFFERYCDESIFTWKTFKTTMGKTKKKFRPMGKVWERPGRGHGSELSVFLVFPWFFAVWPKTSRTQKKKVQTHGQGLGYPHTNQKNKKPKNPKNKKPKKQKTKNTKNQKNQKYQDCTPQGEGVRCRVLGLVFLFFLVFCFFLFFWFFGLCVDSHCRCAKQRLPGTVSGCTRSKVDTLQYSNVCYDIVLSANEQQRGMEFNFVRLRHMLLDLCTGNAAICALPQWPVLGVPPFMGAPWNHHQKLGTSSGIHQQWCLRFTLW